MPAAARAAVDGALIAVVSRKVIGRWPGAVPRPLGYQSAWTDPVNDRVDMGPRWHDPAAGQFTNRDGSVFCSRWLRGAMPCWVLLPLT
jgi:hypothetical protein